ncbi:MAG: NHL repeat-containing protein [Nitrospirae bacterium]|nr:NHL repeat-containing protein [Nitrospirota bacterium]
MRYALLCLFFFLFLVLPAVPAHAIRLTNVKHVLDITGNFSEPSDVSVSKDGRVYIVDGVNNSVKVFNQNGKHVFSFGKIGSGNGEFRSPLGIDVDSSGRVYIADSGNRRIQIFNSNGSFITQVNMPSKNGSRPDPTDIAVDRSHDKFYVVDNNNHYRYLIPTASFIPCLETLIRVQ